MFRDLSKLILILLLPASAYGISTFTLETGEIIMGNVLTKTAENVEVKTAYGNIKIPYSAIKSEEVDDANSTPAENMSAQAQNLFVSTKAGVEEAAELPPLAFFPDSGSTNDAKETLEARIVTWQKQYRTFLESWVPDGWKFNLRGGLTIEHTTTSKTLFSFGASAKKEWEIMSFSFDTFYNYETQTSTAGVTTTTTDKYGFSSDFRWSFFGSDSNWFISDIVSYRHDGIKKILEQIDNGVGMGYSFKIPEWGIQWDISFGPAARYINAVDYEYHWVPMAMLNEELRWDITDILRFEHKGYMGMGLNTGNEGSIYVMIGLVFMPEEIVSLALRYTNDYDSINSQSVIKNEQRLIFSIEVPIRGYGEE